MNNLASSSVESGDLDFVWRPLKIGSTEVKNRIMMTAQTVLFGDDHLLGDRHVEYYRERAKGGVTLFICEQQAGHHISKGSFNEGCTAADPACIPQYRKLADAVHEHGAKQFVQLFGAGIHDKGVTIFDEWHPLWGVSSIRSILHNEMPMVMQQQHIDDVASGFGQSAVHVKEAGIDGVELHAAHSYLFGQFLSKAYNRRDDAYGGSVANRARILVEVGEEIRKRVGPDFTLGVRISYDEFIGDAGIVPEESDEVVDILCSTGLFDFMNISAGGYHTLFRAVAPTGSPKGEFLQFGKRAKDIAGDRAKVFVVGRMTNLHIAEKGLQEGCGDMMALTRANMADPYLVRKTKEGREKEIVHCIGANECINRAFYQRRVTCVMNPSVGREAYMKKEDLVPLPADQRKKIAVVGGGPSGMRAAETLGRRGHNVTLYEKTDALGGHLKSLTILPRWSEWKVGIENLVRGVETANVEVLLNKEATVVDIKALDVDACFVATGSTWDHNGDSPYRPDRTAIPGSDDGASIGLDAALTALEHDKSKFGKKVLIFDESGAYPPLGLAEQLAESGIEVVIVTTKDTPGSDLLGRGELFQIMPRLVELGITMRSQTMIDAIKGDSVSVQSIWGGADNNIEDVDCVVMAASRSSVDTLLSQATEQLDCQVIAVGDCLAPRSLVAIMFEAEDAARNFCKQ